MIGLSFRTARTLRIFLHLIQAEVSFIQGRPGTLDEINILIGTLTPGEGKETFQIGPDHLIFA